MNKICEPNCELPWDLYLDWLADQGFDELRGINPECLSVSSILRMEEQYHDFDLNIENSYSALGDGGLVERFMIENNVSIAEVGNGFSQYMNLEATLYQNKYGYNIGLGSFGHGGCCI